MNFDQFAPYIARFVSAVPAAIAVLIGAVVFNFLVKRGLKLLAARTSLTDSDLAPFGKVASWVIFLLAPSSCCSACSASISAACGR